MSSGMSSPPGSVFICSEMRNESFDEILSLFSEYLSIEDISRLDVAICNKVRRQEFLTLIRSERFVINGEKQQKVGYISWLSFRSIQIRQLNCDRTISEHELMKIANCSKFLQKIKLSNRNITDRSIIKIAESCPNLRILNLARCDRVTNRSVIKIAENCPDLKELNLSGCYSISDTSIIRIAESCPNMIELNLSGCRDVTDVCTLRIAESCSKLLRLILPSSN